MIEFGDVKIGEVVLIPFMGREDKLIVFRWPFDEAGHTQHFLETSAQSAMSKVSVMV